MKPVSSEDARAKLGLQVKSYQCHSCLFCQLHADILAAVIAVADLIAYLLHQDLGASILGFSYTSLSSTSGLRVYEISIPAEKLLAFFGKCGRLFPPDRLLSEASAWSPKTHAESLTLVWG